jgi:hypothetical protein
MRYTIVTKHWPTSPHSDEVLVFPAGAGFWRRAKAEEYARKLAIAKWKPGVQVVIMRGYKEVAAFPFNPWERNEIDELIKRCGIDKVAAAREIEDEDRVREVEQRLFMRWFARAALVSVGLYFLLTLAASLR